MYKEIMNGFDHMVRAGMETMDVPGLTIAIIKDGEIVYESAYGYADLANKVEMTTDHILPLGSSTKTFTATAAAMLMGEGKLDIDKPLRDYMPEFRMYDMVATEQATARDILCHRTGLPRHDFMWIRWDSLKRGEIMGRLRYLENNMPFRNVWQYQNIMYAAAGQLIESIAGETWEDFVSERIFKPLEMNHTNFSAAESEKTGMFARLYEKDAAGVHQLCEPLVLDGMAPAGAINATIGDAAKWVQFNLAGGIAAGEPLVESRAFAQLHTPNIPYQLLPFDLDGVARMGYGLGWFIDSFRGEKLMEHGGNVNGATALVSFIPELNAGCAIMANATSTFLPKALSYIIYDHFMGRTELTDWVAAINEKLLPFRAMVNEAMDAFRNSGIEGKSMTHEAEEYAGTYSHPGYGEVTVRNEDGKLWIKYHDEEFPLIHLHYDIFYFDIQEMPMSVSAVTAVDGSIQSFHIDLEGTLAPIAFMAEK